MSETIPSIKSYLIRAIYDWCKDCNYTPHLSVLVTPDVRVPKDYVKNGEIVLNIGALATHGLQISNNEITFVGRFGGKPQEVSVPIFNVLAIFSKENGQGISFEITSSKITDHKHVPEIQNAKTSLRVISESENKSSRKETKNTKDETTVKNKKN